VFPTGWYGAASVNARRCAPRVPARVLVVRGND